MGITGLLPFLEQASRSCHISEFRGATVAVDTYCWLHKGAFGCAEKLIRGEETSAYVQYCVKYVRMLRSYDITPILVFDGKHLPAKKVTEQFRKEKRKNAEKKAAELLRLGRVDEAKSQMKSAIDVTHKMALALIKECRQLHVDCIVAPYEADAQLAFFSMKKFVHLVITEDSDLLLFGCSRIFVKMDIHGSGTLVDAHKINNCMRLRHNSYNFNKFRYMCILSGCDYLANLPGVGIKKGLKFVAMTANPNIYDVLPKLPSYLKLPNLVIPEEYKAAFMIADATFQHQIVYDPLKRQLRPLTDPQLVGTKLEYCVNAGQQFDEATAFQIALGNVDPLSNEKYDDWCPDRARVLSTSIWSRNYQKPGSLSKKQPARLVPPSTKNMQVNIMFKEEDQENFDSKLKQELQMYSVSKVSRKRTVEVDVEPQPGTSSQAVNIPFKKIKHGSKFQNTLIDSTNTCTSKFFSKKSKDTSPVTIQESPASPSPTEDDVTEIKFDKFAAPKMERKKVVDIKQDILLAPGRSPRFECNIRRKRRSDEAIVPQEKVSKIETIVIDSDKSSQEFDSDVDRKRGNRFEKFSTDKKQVMCKRVVTIESDSDEIPSEVEQTILMKGIRSVLPDWSSYDSEGGEENKNTQKQNYGGNIEEIINDSFERDSSKDVHYTLQRAAAECNDVNFNVDNQSVNSVGGDNSDEQRDEEMPLVTERGGTSETSSNQGDGDKDFHEMDTASNSCEQDPPTEQEDAQEDAPVYEPEMPKLIRVVGQPKSFERPIYPDTDFHRPYFNSDEEYMPEGSSQNFYEDIKQAPSNLYARENVQRNYVSIYTSFNFEKNGSSSSDEAGLDINNERLRKIYRKKSPLLSRTRRPILTTRDLRRHKRQLNLATMLKRMQKR